ncbi:hypothetical protein [Paracoccus ravus]|uniref:hypothetical protein n=1 Tax=Paracoccus ravus TaxID=2447760 RepID=UPI00106F0925|nr:hypothetical protein [Paracoccus ravus]
MRALFAFACLSFASAPINAGYSQGAPVLSYSERTGRIELNDAKVIAESGYAPMRIEILWCKKGGAPAEFEAWTAAGALYGAIRRDANERLENNTGRIGLAVGVTDIVALPWDGEEEDQSMVYSDITIIASIADIESDPSFFEGISKDLPFSKVNVKSGAVPRGYIALQMCVTAPEVLNGNRLFIQVKDNTDIAPSESVRMKLLKEYSNIWVAKGIEVVGNRSPTSNQLRYFWEEDKVSADQVAQTIEGFTGVEAKPIFVPGYPNVRKGTLEAWFATLPERIPENN